MMNEKYQQDVAKLIETSPETWAWIRRRAGHHYYRMMGCELEGSSDVSCHVYSLWQDYDQADNDTNIPKTLANLGWWINGEICDMMDIPRTKATVEFHNSDRA